MDAVNSLVWYWISFSYPSSPYQLILQYIKTWSVQKQRFIFKLLSLLSLINLTIYSSDFYSVSQFYLHFLLQIFQYYQPSSPIIILSGKSFKKWSKLYKCLLCKLFCTFVNKHCIIFLPNSVLEKLQLYFKKVFMKFVYLGLF